MTYRSEARSWSDHPADYEPRPSVLDRYAALILIASALLIAVGLVVGDKWQETRLTDNLRDRCALVAEPAFVDECVRDLR